MRIKKPDRKNAKSLIEAARRRMRYTHRLEVDEESAATIAGNVYECFRMLGDALLIARGMSFTDHTSSIDPQNAREAAIADAVRSIEGKVVAVLGSIHASKDPGITGTRIETVGFRLRDECCSVNASRTHLPGYDLEPFVRAFRERKG